MVQINFDEHKYYICRSYLAVIMKKKTEIVFIVFDFLIIKFH